MLPKDYMTKEQLERHHAEYALLRKIGDRRFGSECGQTSTAAIASVIS